jgi:hypothetical protein
MLELETTTPQATAVPTTAVAEKTTTAAAAKKAEVGGHDFGENIYAVFEYSFLFYRFYARTKSWFFRYGPKWHGAQPPPTCPSNVSVRIKALRTGP